MHPDGEDLLLGHDVRPVALEGAEQGEVAAIDDDPVLERRRARLQASIEQRTALAIQPVAGRDECDRCGQVRFLRPTANVVEGRRSLVGAPRSRSARLSARGSAVKFVAEPLVGSDVARRLVPPREDVHDALPALLAHVPPAFGIVEELADRAGVRGHVVRLDVDGGVVRRDTRLLQVEGDDRKLERHVLHRLVHRGDVVQRVERIRGEPEIGGREHLGHDLVRDPAR